MSPLVSTATPSCSLQLRSDTNNIVKTAKEQDGCFWLCRWRHRFAVGSAPVVADISLAFVGMHGVFAHLGFRGSSVCRELIVIRCWQCCVTYNDVQYYLLFLIRWLINAVII